MSELRPCPFCGGVAKLVRVATSYKDNPTTIMDEWEVKCLNGCCNTIRFQDNIYHKGDGEIVVESNGAKDAIEHWNQRYYD